MDREEYRQKRLRHLEELRAAGHHPELGSVSGVLGQSFGRQVDYIWCTRCGRRDIRWFPKSMRPLSPQKRCPGSPDASL